MAELHFICPSAIFHAIEAMQSYEAQPVPPKFIQVVGTVYRPQLEIWKPIFDGRLETIPAFDTNAKSTLGHLEKCTR